MLVHSNEEVDSYHLMNKNIKDDKILHVYRLKLNMLIKVFMSAF